MGTINSPLVLSKNNVSPALSPPWHETRRKADSGPSLLLPSQQTLGSSGPLPDPQAAGFPSSPACPPSILPLLQKDRGEKALWTLSHTATPPQPRQWHEPHSSRQNNRLKMTRPPSGPRHRGAAGTVLLASQEP